MYKLQNGSLFFIIPEASKTLMTITEIATIVADTFKSFANKTTPPKEIEFFSRGDCSLKALSEVKELNNAIKTNPQLNHQKTYNLSDGSPLHIFSSPLNSKFIIGALELPNGKLQLSLNDEHEMILSLLYSRNPEDYSFAIVEDTNGKGNEKYQITIVPTWTIDQKNNPLPYPGMHDWVVDVEPMWNTPWWKGFHDKHFGHCMEYIWNPKNNEQGKVPSIDNIYDFMSQKGFVYSAKLESDLCEENDLDSVAGWLAIASKIQPSTPSITKP